MVAAGQEDEPRGLARAGVELLRPGVGHPLVALGVEQDQRLGPTSATASRRSCSASQASSGRDVGRGDRASRRADRAAARPRRRGRSRSRRRSRARSPPRGSRGSRPSSSRARRRGSRPRRRGREQRSHPADVRQGRGGQLVALSPWPRWSKLSAAQPRGGAGAPEVGVALLARSPRRGRSTMPGQGGGGASAPRASTARPRGRRVRSGRLGVRSRIGPDSRYMAL